MDFTELLFDIENDRAECEKFATTDPEVATRLDRPMQQSLAG